MRSSIILVALTAPATLAFPWLRPEGVEALLDHPEARAEINRRLQDRNAAQKEPRQLRTGLIPGLLDLLGGTLEATLDPLLGIIPTKDSVNGLKRFPEGQYLHSPSLCRLLTVLANYPFQAPGPTDQRGPCPGFNTLANHGCM